MNASHQQGWVAEPDSSGRGTANIIYTCFFTIYACTWSALHLNIPRRGMSSFERFIRKINWMLVAVLAPGYITLTALVQRSDVDTALSKTWPRLDRSPALVFYALMGGFEIRFIGGTYQM